jgi:Cu/Zn superoxide dismutase
MRLKQTLMTLGIVMGIAASVRAQDFSFTTPLSSDQERLVPNNSTTLTGASGLGSVVWNELAQTLTVNLTTQNLAADITGAHIHIVANTSTNPTNVNGPVVFDLKDLAGLPAGNIVGSAAAWTLPSLTITQASSGLSATTFSQRINDIRNGFGYFNVHNAGSLTTNSSYTGPANFAGGQIRGNINASAPEPGTLALLGLGPVVMLGIRRRK